MQSNGKNLVVVNMSLVQRCGLKCSFILTELQVTQASGNLCRYLFFVCFKKSSEDAREGDEAEMGAGASQGDDVLYRVDTSGVLFPEALSDGLCERAALNEQPQPGLILNWFSVLDSYTQNEIPCRIEPIE